MSLQRSPGLGRRLMAVVGAQRWWILATAALATITMSSGVGLIAFAAYLITRASVAGTTTGLALTITGVRFFAVVRVVSRYLERYVGHLGTFRMLTRIRVWFFRGIAPLAPAGLVEHRRGDLLSRISDDVDTLQDLSLRVLVPPLAAAVTAVVVAVVLGSFSVQIALTVLLFLLLCGVVLPLVTRRLVHGPAVSTLLEAAAVSTTVVESLDGISELVSAGRTDLLVEPVRSATQRQMRAQRALAQLRGITAGLATLLSGSCAIVVVAMGTVLVDRGAIDVVYLALLPLVAIVAFESVQPLAMAIEHLDRSRAAAERLFALVDQTPAVIDPVDPVEVARADGPAIEFCDVDFSYPDAESAVLRGATITIDAGATVALVGASGSGKSTIVDLLLKFREPDSGRIVLFGNTLADSRADELRSLLAVVAQPDHLFDTTVRDNLLLGDADATDDRLLDVCEVVAFADVLASLDAGLDERLGEDGERLSGGERQRLMIARALLVDAPLLVLDEATAHLDSATRRTVMAGIARWRPDGTTLVIAHDAATFDDVDAVIELSGGVLRPVSV